DCREMIQDFVFPLIVQKPCYAQRPTIGIGRRPIHSDNPLGSRITELRIEQRPEQAEDHRVDADAERQRQHGYRGETRTLAERAHAVANVTYYIFNQLNATRVTTAFFYELQAAKGSNGRYTGFRGSHSLRRSFLDFALDVAANLLVQFTLYRSP